MTLHVDGISLFCFLMGAILLFIVHGMLIKKARIEGYWEGYSASDKEWRKRTFQIK